MENVIGKIQVAKNYEKKMSLGFLNLVSRFVRLWNAQIDYEKVDRQIQESRLKYEIYRMSL